jgi:hypothetical protein
VIRNEGGRSVIHCDRCPVRLDLGPTGIVQPRLRMPSGWVQNQPQRHLCPLCSRKELGEMVASEPPPGT